MRREMLSNISNEDVQREGFPDWTWLDFVHFFCEHMKCNPGAQVTRIEFRYLPGERQPTVTVEVPGVSS